MITGVELGTQFFAEADQAWQKHLAKSPDDVGNLLLFFERLREKAKEIAPAARRARLPFWEVKEAYRAAAEESIRTILREWMDLAEREHEVFEHTIANLVPISTHALIFPDDPPASNCDAQVFAILHDAFRGLAREIGLECPDRPPPVRKPRSLEPPAHLNRHQRRAWLSRNREVAA